MKITDLTEFYQKYITGKISVDEYENSCPELFDYYNRFWSSTDHPYKEISPEELQTNKKQILNELPFIEQKFSQAGFDLSDLELILFIGKGTSNGHAMRLDNRFVVWLTVETYTSEMLAKIFVAHEIIHALHYTASPEFYFNTKDEQEDFGRQLITEGIATFLTQKLLDVTELEALWADYLLPEDAERWLNDCRAMENELSAYCIEQWVSNSDSNNPAFFRADNPDNLFEFRAGYYIGTRIIARLFEQNSLTPKQLLSISRDDILHSNIR
ncbi:MAG: hypothetical protein KAR42_00610 [candidate division Zixibacteria bacterium]|nr:hypothetical protein [candidate division Zixibacteria bacterium]